MTDDWRQQQQQLQCCSSNTVTVTAILTLVVHNMYDGKLNGTRARREHLTHQYTTQQRFAPARLSIFICCVLEPIKKASRPADDEIHDENT